MLQDTWRKIAAAAIAGALLSGCTSTEDPSQGTPAATGATSAAAATPGEDEQASQSAAEPSAPDDASAAGGEATGGEELGDLGSRDDTVVPGSRVTLNSVRVNGETMTVTFSLTNMNEDGGDRIAIQTEFSNGTSDEEDASRNSAERYSVDGVFVVTEEGKRYLVGRGDDGVCACSTDISGNTEPGATTTYSAVFAAPPATVDVVDVHIPTAGAFEGVELAR